MEISSLMVSSGTARCAPTDPWCRPGTGASVAPCKADDGNRVRPLAGHTRRPWTVTDRMARQPLRRSGEASWRRGARRAWGVLEWDVGQATEDPGGPGGGDG